MNKKKLYTPLLIPLLSLMVGIFLTHYVSLSNTKILVGIIFPLVMCIGGSLYKNSKAIKVAVSLLFFLFGGLLVNFQKQEFELTLALFKNEKVTLIGTILEKDPWIGRPGGELMRVSVCEIYHSYTSYHQHFSCDVLVYSPYPTHVDVGDLIQLKSVEMKASSKNDYQTPTYQDYLFKEGIIASLFITGSNYIKTLYKPTWNLRKTLWGIRKKICLSINQKLNDTTRTYFNLIFLGNKHQENNTELREFFGYWGLSHYLARSGLHIVLFIIMWTYLLCLIPIHISFKRILLIILCIIYDLVSWTSIPFLRAYYAFLCMKFGELLGLHIHYIHILSLLCMGMLLFNPLLLLFLDFQLTFLLTFILVIISQEFNQSSVTTKTF